ncbi:MAG: transglycosylase domain-containing protein, partial [Patescibacteria group bacterium]
MASFFIALGRPVLFFLKILLWTVVWFFQKTIQVLGSLWEILRSTFNTFAWFYKLILKFPYQKYFPKKPRLKIIYQKPKISFARDFLLITAGFFACFLFVFIPYSTVSFLSALPNPKALANHDYSVTTKIFDRHSLLLYQIYSRENRTPIKLSDLPKYIPEATIAIEDKNFYRHLGFDPFGIIRAFIANIQGRPQQGGSTITQQLIKSALLTPERTFTRKVKELILSFWTERLYSKDQILEMYLNQVPYGGAAYGIEAASQTYFNKHAKDLSLAEAALLAGLPSAPSVYSPFGSHPELAKSRQKDVLLAMKAPDAAFTENLNYAPQSTEIKAPHFVMYVKDILTQKYGIRTVEQGGLEVITSLDLNLQEETEIIISSEVEEQKYLQVGNGAALVTNPKTGEILAMVGSKDYFAKDYDGNVNVTLSQRSPGSSIKVVNYAAALEKGLISPGTVIDDGPITYQTLGSPPYSPQNYDSRFHGKVTVRTALASSYNIPAVKILQKLGVANMFDKGRQMG